MEKKKAKKTSFCMCVLHYNDDEMIGVEYFDQHLEISFVF